MLHNNNILTEESSRRSLMLLAVITFYSLFYNSQNCQWYYSLCFMWQYYCHAYLFRVVYLPKIYTLSQDKAKSIKTNTHTHPFNGPFSGTTQVSRYQKGKTNLEFTEARDSEWQWHQLGHMQVCTLLQTDNHASTPALCFLQAGCPSCRPTNSVKALKAIKTNTDRIPTGKISTCTSSWWPLA